VLIKHNLLTNIAVKLLENKNNANVSLPDGIVRVCGELHKNCVHGYCKNIKHYTVPSSKNYKKKKQNLKKKKKRRFEKNVKNQWTSNTIKRNHFHFQFHFSTFSDTHRFD